MVEVAVGPLANPDRINVPVHAASVYSNWDKVTLVENPANPSERRLTGIFDLWYPALTRTLSLALVVLTLMLLWTVKIGYREVWSAGGWVDVSDPRDVSPAWIAVVQPPPSAWKANLLWGAILGPGLLLGAVFLGSEKHQLIRIFTGWLGLIFLLSMARQSVENYTGSLRTNRERIERRWLGGSRRADWSDIVRVELTDQGAKLEKLRGLGSQGRMKPANDAVPSIRQWVFADSAGNEIFRMDRESVPKDQVRKMLELAGSRVLPD